MLQADIERGISIAKLLVERFKLDLRGLNVVTECAGNGYAFTVVMARLAGAYVYAVGKDSRFGTASENKKLLHNILTVLHIQGGYDVFFDHIPASIWHKADIVMNTGFVRPLKAQIIRMLKPTAVIPLMWEPWEFRPEDLDLRACQQYEIPVIGTNESYPLLNMFAYTGMMALKLLFEMNIEVHNNKLVLLGGHKTGEHIAQTFDKMGVEYYWFTPTGKETDDRCYSYEELNRLLVIKNLDAIICVEHVDRRCLFGPDGFIDFSGVKNAHPYIRWGHICGNIDINSLSKSGIFFLPQQILPAGYISYQSYELGIRPVLELHAAGLKVGEIAGRARLNGATVEETIQATVAYGVGMDFEGGFLNYGR